MESKEREVVRVEAGAGRMLWVLGDLYEIKATREETGGAYALIDVTSNPGIPGPPPHIHHGEDEAFYVLEGEIELTVKGEVFMVGPGSFVNAPKGTPHTFRNAGTTPARFLALLAPAGLENFFEEIGEPATDPSSPPAGPPDVEKIMATAPRYGVEILPPPGA